MFKESNQRRVIIRAIGPELGAPPYSIPDAMVNPTLELHDGTGALIASNDNWMNTIIGGIITSDQVHDIRDSAHAPTDPRESAIIAKLPPGKLHRDRPRRKQYHRCWAGGSVRFGLIVRIALQVLSHKHASFR